MEVLMVLVLYNTLVQRYEFSENARKTPFYQNARLGQ